jgi:hypothetical protein
MIEVSRFDIKTGKPIQENLEGSQQPATKQVEHSYKQSSLLLGFTRVLMISTVFGWNLKAKYSFSPAAATATLPTRKLHI